ncbi:MAG: diguanylate cyclase [Candidatus Omnitrophota bacterium]|jgi:predicted signal transduction protein with EAL and GGDEF domain
MILLAIEDIAKRKEIKTALQENGKRFKCISFHDSLTGFYNRVYFAEEMIRLGKDIVHLRPISIISINIDGLKLINDIFRHNAGDEFLIRAAKIISAPFRRIDIAAMMSNKMNLSDDEMRNLTLLAKIYDLGKAGTPRTQYCLNRKNYLKKNMKK